jgi:hypothetical protein
MFKSIVCTYPDFRELPKGLKQMLLASENLFFSEVQAPTARANEREMRKNHLLPPLKRRFFTSQRETPHEESRAFRWEFWKK